MTNSVNDSKAQDSKAQHSKAQDSKARRNEELSNARDASERLHKKLIPTKVTSIIKHKHFKKMYPYNAVPL